MLWGINWEHLWEVVWFRVKHTLQVFVLGLQYLRESLLVYLSLERKSHYVVEHTHYWPHVSTFPWVWNYQLYKLWHYHIERREEKFTDLERLMGFLRQVKLAFIIWVINGKLRIIVSQIGLNHQRDSDLESFEGLCHKVYKVFWLIARFINCSAQYWLFVSFLFLLFFLELFHFLFFNFRVLCSFLLFLYWLEIFLIF